MRSGLAKRKRRDDRYQFPYIYAQKEAEKQQLRYWDGMSWVTVKRKPSWLPPKAVITGDPELSRVLGLLVLEFGEGLSVQIRPKR